MIQNNFSSWSIAWNEKMFRRNFFIGISFLIFILIIFFFVLQYIEQRKGFVIEKGWLDSILKPNDFSFWIFTCTYSSVIAGIIFCLRKPSTTLLLIRAYAILQLLRAITLLLVPLDPPQKIIALNDPFLQSTFYHGNANIKDLFFSGHVATIVLFIPIITNKWLNYFLCIAAFLAAIFLAWQRVHYILDIVAAPIFSATAFLLAKKQLRSKN